MSTKEPGSAAEDLIDNTDQGRFELHREEDLVGWLYYTRLRPNRYALRHTEVEPSLLCTNGRVWESLCRDRCE